MIIYDVNVNDIKPYKNNPRKNDQSVAAVAESIKQFGFKVPIVIDKNNEIVAGHTRLKAALQLGIQTVPCLIADDLTEEQIKAFRLADNKTAELADWDFELLNVELEELGKLDLGFSMADFGFNLSDGKEIKEDDFDAEKAVEEIETPITQLGDIWLLGRHRLVCGDSTKPETYSVLMEGKLTNLVVTDPPYSVNYSGKAGSIKNDNLSDEEFYKFLLAFYKNTYEVMEDGAAIYVFHADTEGINFRTALKNAGFHLSSVCIWVKNSLVLGRGDYNFRHEPILYGFKPTGKHKWYSDRKQNTVWEFDRPRRSEIHPTMKPLDLVAYPIKNSSMANCIVLDPFAGSFSTGIACEQTHRICYGIELDPKYVDVCVLRFYQNFPENPIKLNGNPVDPELLFKKS